MLLQQNGVADPIFKTMPLGNSFQEGVNPEFECRCNQQPFKMGYETFPNVSIFGVHAQNESFSKRAVFIFMLFRKAPVSPRSNVNARPDRTSFSPCQYED